MKRTCVAVVGCHRSGTSAVAGVLHKLGVHMGDSLMPTSPANPLGYFEDLPVVKIHEQLMRRLRISWDTEEVPLLPDRSFGVLRARTSLHGYLQSREGDLFGVKDPRLCLFPELWQEIAEALDIRLVPIMVYRNMHSIVQSLCQRDKFKPEHAQAVVRAYASGMIGWGSCPGIQYRDLMEDWRLATGTVTAEAGLEMPSVSAEDEDSIDAFLRPGLNHHGG